MTSEVIFFDVNGEEITTVDVAVADDPQSRYNGLSNVSELQSGEGMLFLYQEEDYRSFVMRDMEFDLDIIFADREGAITEIHEAVEPAEGQTDRTLTEYEGLAQAVVEVPAGFCVQHGIEPDGYIKVLLYD
jgi:uncharacterized membrane protein (UPF0127 family)